MSCRRLYEVRLCRQILCHSFEPLVPNHIQRCIMYGVQGPPECSRTATSALRSWFIAAAFGCVFSYSDIGTAVLVHCTYFWMCILVQRYRHCSPGSLHLLLDVYSRTAMSALQSWFIAAAFGCVFSYSNVGTPILVHCRCFWMCILVQQCRRSNSGSLQLLLDVYSRTAILALQSWFIAATFACVFSYSNVGTPVLVHCSCFWMCGNRHQSPKG